MKPMPMTDSKKWVLLSLLLSLPQFATAQTPQPDDHDYFSSQREMIRNGVQAVLMCNGLFTSRRSLQFGMEYATGSGLSYWAGASSVDGARRRGLDYGNQGFDEWDLTREVLQAFDG